MPNDPGKSAEPTAAVRLVFEYDGDDVRLVGQYPVEMVLLEPLLAAAERRGMFVESRDADSRTLARVAAEDAIETSMEVFPDTPDGAIVRMDVPEPKGAFSVVVAAPPAADHVTVVRVAPAVQATALAAREAAPSWQSTELASFRLDARGRP